MLKLAKKNAVIETLMVCLDYTYFFYKRLALGWQITVSNNKNYKLKKNEVFHLQ